MATVLLRMAPLDSLVTNSETYPPSRESRQPARSAAGEGSAVVSANALGKPELAEDHF
jgi:hypothetical protein